MPGDFMDSSREPSNKRAVSFEETEPNSTKRTRMTSPSVLSKDVDFTQNPVDINGSGSGSRADNLVDTATFEDDDDDPRFSGSGLTQDETEALDYLARRDGQESALAASFDLSTMRKLAAKFEKAINKNQNMRAKYSDDPTKFLESEVELDEAIRSLSVLSEYPELLKDFVAMGCLGSLVGLLSHENSDIACSVIQIISEMTAEETGAETNDLDIMIAEMRSIQAFDTLCQILHRLDETEEAEKTAVFQILSIYENLIGVANDLKQSLFEQTTINPWLLRRLQDKSPNLVSLQNKQYAAELLAIFLQGTESNIETSIRENVVDVVLILLAQYRKVGTDLDPLEEEYVENLFDVLNIILSVAMGKDKFLEEEGVELMQRIMIDAKSATIRHRALQTLEFACSTWSGGAVCAHLIEVGMLGTIFALYMKKEDVDLQRIILALLLSFFRTLNDGEPERIRVLNKFLENDFQKTKRLLLLRGQYAAKLVAFETQQKAALSSRPSFTSNDAVEYDLTQYLDRLDHGLYSLQQVDTILAWLLLSEESLATFIRSQPGLIEALRLTLQELEQNLASKSGDAGLPETGEMLEQKLEHEMIHALLHGI